MCFGSPSPTFAVSFRLVVVLGGSCSVRATIASAGCFPFLVALVTIVAIVAIVVIVDIFLFFREIAVVDTAIALLVTVVAAIAIGSNLIAEYLRLSSPRVIASGGGGRSEKAFRTNLYLCCGQNRLGWRCGHSILDIPRPAEWRLCGQLLPGGGETVTR